MKKTILIALALSAGCALYAQETVAYKGQTTNVYSIPEPIWTQFHTTYTDADSPTWEALNGWWRVTYTDNNNRIVSVYYNMQPYYLVNVPGRDVNYKVALPVLNNYVPDRIITTAINSYGTNLYSITALKMENNENVYQVGLLENGVSRTVWMNPESTVFTGINKMSGDNMKVKTDEEK